MSADAIGWIGFNAFVLVMLALDLGVFHRKPHAITFKEAALWSIFWISLALIFNAGLYHWRGSVVGTEFLTGYLIEKSLSIDNIFVILTIFAYFRIPQMYQHKVLFWGILGALVMRAIFIFAGVALIQKFHWIIYIFGGFLIITAIKMVRQHGEEIEPDKNPVVKLCRRFIPVTPNLVGGNFFIRENGKLIATPLFITLLVVEVSDLIFAVDSIPAILAISSDPFIVYTSNVFAILGLRSLYFTLAGAVQKFVYLHYGLAAILAFVGTKMLIVDIYKIPVALALGVVVGLLAASIFASMYATRKIDLNKAKEAAE
ncbi:MAG: TerC family protein [Oligoflexales bacterium]|nr:TerC family protein [Oligoflexales bacterium]